MPQWDVKCNYYADLELSPNCSTDDIKKQYRKLALKWHPDRNPGQETKVGPKFQQISSAHEILSNEQTRKEYDDARRRRGPYTGASGVRGNPWSNAASNFPPPPTRGNARSAARDRPPASGASRYTSFGNNASASSARPPPPPRATPNDGRNRKSEQDAWNHMKPNTRAHKQAPPSTPGRAPTSAARDSSTPRQEQGTAPPFPPRSASQRQKAEAAFGNSNRRSGYFPGAGIGDEPPVKSSNYSTTRSHPPAFEEPSFTEAPSTPPRKPHSRSSSSGINPIPDPLAQFRDRKPEPRLSSPYATPGGERLNPFDESPGLGRSASTRMPPRRKEVPKNSATYRSRSNSMDVNTGNTGNTESANARTSPHTTAYAAYNSRAGQKYTPEAERQRRPSTHGSSSSMNAQFNAPPTGGNSRPHSAHPKYDKPPQMQFDSKTYTSADDVAIPKDMSDWDLRVMKSRLLHIMKHSSSEEARGPKASSRDYSTSIYSKQGRKPLLGKNTNPSISQVENRYNYRPHKPAAEQAETDANQPFAGSFDFATKNGTYNNNANPNKFASKSAEGINMSFVQEPGDWQFTAGGSENDGQESPSKRRAQSSGRPSRRGSAKPFISQPVAPMQREASTDSIPNKFSAGVWSEQIGSQHFEPQPSSNSSTSPSRRANSRKARPTRKTTGSAAIVDNGEEENWQEVPRPTTEGPVAMDIDSPPRDKSYEAPGITRAQSVRNIPVEPSRPDWRAGNVNNTTTNSASPAGKTTSASQIFADQNSPSKLASTHNPINLFAPTNGGSEDTEEFRTTLSDLRQTEPFTESVPTGLSSFADLNSTLPFQSRPADRPPLSKEPIQVQHLEFPSAPIAPRLPPTVPVPHTRPNLAQWQTYSTNFCIYMDKWQTFNKKVVEHFNARETNFAERRSKRGGDWLDKGDGVDEYMIEIEQDLEVRQKWNKACDDHRDRIREFSEFRSRMK